MGGVVIGIDSEESRRIWARTIRYLRGGRGWSQRALAERLQQKNQLARRITPDRENIKRTIQNWESEACLPSEDYGVVLLLVFTRDDELPAGRIHPGSELEAILSAFEQMGATLDRRRFLLNAAAAVVCQGGGFRDWHPIPQELDREERLEWLLRHPGKVDAQAVSHLRDSALELLGQCEADVPGSALLPYAARRLEQAAFLRAHAPVERLRRELCAVEALASTVAGRIAWDMHREPMPAAYYYRHAVELGGHALEGWVRAFPLHCQAVIAFNCSEDLRAAQELAGRSRALAQDGSSPTMAGWFTAFAGEVQAQLGDERGALRALDAAYAQLGRVQASDPARAAFKAEQLEGFRGAYLLRLGRLEDAAAALAGAARALSAGDKPKHRAVVLADLATVRARQRQPEAACSLLREVIELVGETGAGIGVQRLRLAAGELRPWADLPCVQEVWEGFHDLGAWRRAPRARRQAPAGGR